MKKCGACRVIVSGDSGSAHLCEVCRNSEAVKDAFTWYRIVRGLRRDVRVFLWGFPILIAVAEIANLLAWWAWPSCVLSWVGTLIVYRKQNVAAKVLQAKEELWLAKLGG